MLLVVENPLANAGDIRDMSLIPGLGRSPGGGHGLRNKRLLWLLCRKSSSRVTHGPGETTGKSFTVAR